MNHQAHFLWQTAPPLSATQKRVTRDHLQIVVGTMPFFEMVRAIDRFADELDDFVCDPAQRSDKVR